VYKRYDQATSTGLLGYDFLVRKQTSDGQNQAAIRFNRDLSHIVSLIRTLNDSI